MQKEFLIQQIENKCGQYDVVVLKGIKVNDILSIESCYEVLDKEYFVNGKIAIDKMTSAGLFKLLTMCKGKCVMTIDTLVFISTFLKSLSFSDLKFCILENNLIERYENPSTVDIPQFGISDNEYYDNSAIYSIIL